MRLLLQLALVATMLVATAAPSDGQTHSTNRLVQRNRAAQRVTAEAPLVFVGRPLAGEFYRDSAHHLYHTTLVEVLEVLRGDASLTRGTLQLTDSLGLAPSELELSMGRGDALTKATWGVYFCQASAWPANPYPYTVDNAQALRLYGRNREALLYAVDTTHGQFIQGLYHVFYSEGSVMAFLREVPNLRPISQPASSYPARTYQDTRPVRSAAAASPAKQ
ncbi:hypothetical protein [Hymenobacter jeollabukensis]|uniref:Uncharacterized protein n=1 Tax=Hymenobacter jeollabukensis TaxID=2025313 RepID=A0A5R8WJV9_9BACT|nr:hypothetical protein [Hymenobacter jeollabukensis]TLM88784.1 hypothetical protein FDY95_23405 [Hymenobacter jeollabukensis]